MSLILGGRITCRLMAFPARVLVYRHIPASQEPMSPGRLRQNSDAAISLTGRVVLAGIPLVRFVRFSGM